SILTNTARREGFVGLIFEILRDEVIARYLRRLVRKSSAMARCVKHKHVARSDLLGEIGEDLVEMRGGGIAVEDLGDEHVLKKVPYPLPSGPRLRTWRRGRHM